MKNEKMIHLPASYTALTEDEMTYTQGGGIETVVGGVLAVGATVALAYVGGMVLGGVGSLLGDDTAIGSALTAGANIMAAPGALVAGLVSNLVGTLFGSI